MEAVSLCGNSIRFMKNAVWDDNEMATIQNKDRLLPSQPYFSKMYNGKDFYGDLERVLSCGGMKLDIKTKDGMTYAVMGSDLNTLHFYQFLIRLHGYNNILELGTYIGVYAMYLAVTGASVTTVEKELNLAALHTRIFSQMDLLLKLIS